MSFDVPPLTTTFAARSVDRSNGAAGRNDATIFDPRTDGATPPIPTEVWDQVDAAARLAESLHSEGRGVRFDVHKLDGDVVASLVDEDGGMLRPLLLTEVVDVNRLSRELGRDPAS